MKTIDLKSYGRDKFSSDDFDPLVAVSDGRLVVTNQPARSGVFSTNSHPLVAPLPSINAKSFRLTNSGSSNIDVSQKSIIHSRYFDETSVGVIPDSPSLNMKTLMDETPLGNSQVLQVTHTDDTAVFTTVPVLANQSNLTYVIYFKMSSVDSELTPLGIYNNRASIDINHPAAAIRVLPDLSLKVRVGYNDHIPIQNELVQLNKWHRATIGTNGVDFSISVQRYEAGGYVDLVPSFDSYSLSGNPVESWTSHGVGLLSEILNDPDYVIAVASEGAGVQTVDSLEVYTQSDRSEVLIAGTTKEYFCHRSLDEFSVSGDVSGYYRS